MDEQKFAALEQLLSQLKPVMVGKALAGRDSALENFANNLVHLESYIASASIAEAHGKELAVEFLDDCKAARSITERTTFQIATPDLFKALLCGLQQVCGDGIADEGPESVHMVGMLADWIDEHYPELCGQ